MSVLTEIGVVAPRIVTKVVHARNYLEHEYRKPGKEQVEDAVDVATLFVAGLERSLTSFPACFDLTDRLPDGPELVSGDLEAHKRLAFNFNTDRHWFEIYGCIHDFDMEKQKYTPVFFGRSILKASDRGYCELIRLCFSFNKSPTLEDDCRKYLLFVLDS
jgi:hypothetical protein